MPDPSRRRRAPIGAKRGSNTELAFVCVFSGVFCAQNLLSFLDLCKSLCLFLHGFVTAHYLLLYSTGWFRLCGVCWRDQEQREFPAHVEEADPRTKTRRSGETL